MQPPPNTCIHIPVVYVVTTKRSTQIQINSVLRSKYLFLDNASTLQSNPHGKGGRSSKPCTLPPPASCIAPPRHIGPPQAQPRELLEQKSEAVTHTPKQSTSRPRACQIPNSSTHSRGVSPQNKSEESESERAEEERKATHRAAARRRPHRRRRHPRRARSSSSYSTTSDRPHQPAPPPQQLKLVLQQKQRQQRPHWIQAAGGGGVRGRQRSGVRWKRRNNAQRVAGVGGDGGGWD
jgi:hypothetical protein